MKQEDIKKMMYMAHKLKLFHSRIWEKGELTNAESVVLIAIADRSRLKSGRSRNSASTSDVARHMGGYASCDVKNDSKSRHKGLCAAGAGRT